MSNQAMTTMKPLGLSTIQLPHAEREGAVYGFHKDMIMGGHLTRGMHDPMKTVTDITKDFQPGFAILIGSINSFAPVSS